MIAENIYGKSAPSDESSPVTIRETTKKKVQKRTYEGQSRANILDSVNVSIKFLYCIHDLEGVKTLKSDARRRSLFVCMFKKVLLVFGLDWQ